MIWLFAVGQAWAGWVITDVTIIDAHQKATVESMVIEQDTIAYIGPKRAADQDLEQIDGNGLYVIPGLVDAHVHLSMAPGGAFVERTAEEVTRRRRHYLKAYVASGVAAVLDTGILASDARAFLSLAETTPSPTIRFLGPLVSPVGGYVHRVVEQFEPTPDVPTLHRQLEAFDPLSPIGVKVTMEDGMLQKIWPFHTDEVLAALKAQPRPVMVHAFDEHEYQHALDHLDVTAFVHPPGSPLPQLVPQLEDIEVMTTLSVLDSLLIGPQPDRLNHPLFQTTVPRDELERAKDPATKRASAEAVVGHMLPKLPRVVRNMGLPLFQSPMMVNPRLKDQMASIKLLHDNGIELVLGSDSGNWPVFLYEFHGPTTVRELELIVQAGIPTRQAIGIATLHGAKLLGIDHRLGTIEEGKEASFLILDSNPLDDIAHVSTPKWVVHHGIRKTPKDWIDTPPSPQE